MVINRTAKLRLWSLCYLGIIIMSDISPLRYTYILYVFAGPSQSFTSETAGCHFMLDDNCACMDGFYLESNTCVKCKTFVVEHSFCFFKRNGMSNGEGQSAKCWIEKIP